MGMFFQLMVQQDWRYFLPILFHLIPCTLIIILQSILSTKIAKHLGDLTPQLNGRGKFHFFPQIDPIGLLLFITTGIGWGQYFPLKPDNFKKPKLDTAKVLLLSTLPFYPISFFSLTLASLCFSGEIHNSQHFYLIWILADLAVLSLSFPLFQLLPIPCFSCFQVIYPSLPQSMQEKLDKYHPHLILILITLLWSGILHKPMTAILSLFLQPICSLVQFPFPFLQSYLL